MEVKRIIKKQLIMDLDKNEAPTGWRWAVDRIVDFGAGEKVVQDFIPATAEEVETHVRCAIGKQAEDIKRDSEAYQALKEDRDALQRQLDTNKALLAKVREDAPGAVASIDKALA